MQQLQAGKSIILQQKQAGKSVILQWLQASMRIIFPQPQAGNGYHLAMFKSGHENYIAMDTCLQGYYLVTVSAGMLCMYCAAVGLSVACTRAFLTLCSI